MSEKVIHKCDRVGCTKTTTNREKETGWVFFEAPGRDGVYVSRSDGERIDRTGPVSDFCSLTCLNGLLAELRALRLGFSSSAKAPPLYKVHSKGHPYGSSKASRKK
jgi:hypothetical protein